MAIDTLAVANTIDANLEKVVNEAKAINPIENAMLGVLKVAKLDGGIQAINAAIFKGFGQVTQAAVKGQQASQ